MSLVRLYLQSCKDSVEVGALHSEAQLWGRGCHSRARQAVLGQLTWSLLCPIPVPAPSSKPGFLSPLSPLMHSSPKSISAAYSQA